MVITELVLYKSKRLGFNGIDKLVYTPEHIHQIILGTNGSGKSSLMGELSPLPATGNDYFKGGFKKISITHRDRSFELLNDFGSKSAGVHSFLVDGVELNDGGTVTVQKQLVKEYFDLDQDLFDLLIGSTSFREMSPNQRRHWLVRMADDNMEYAISLYNKVMKQHRDAGAVVKYHDDRLTKEMNKVPDLDARREELLKEQEVAKTLHRDLSRIMGGREHLNPKAHLARYNEVLAGVKRVSDDILKLEYLDGNPYTNPDHIPLAQERLNAKLETLNEHINTLARDHIDIKETVEALVAQGGEDIKSLEVKRDSLISRQNQLLGSINHFPPIKELDSSILVRVTDDISDRFIDTLTNLPDNSTGYIVRDVVDTKKREREQLVDSINANNPRINKLEYLIHHLTHTDKVDCPQCNHSFIPGMSQYDVKQLQSELNSLNGERTDNQEKIALIDEYLLEVNTYMNKYRDLTNIMDNAKSLEPLWEHLRTFKLTEYSPNKYLILFDVWQNEIHTLSKARLLDKDLAALEDAINKLNETTNSHQKYNQNTLDGIEEQLSKSNIERTKIQGQLKYLEKLLLIKQKAEFLSDKLSKGLDALEDSYCKYEDESLLEFVSEQLDDTNVQLGKISIELTNLDVAKELIADLTRRREEAAVRQELLGMLVKELSPTSGLIADHSLKFITQFTDQMNLIINSIWTYDMQLLPLAISEDLTYKFPVYMAESETETPDINKASTAQKSVIDFAFKILLITYLGLEDYPLYLDELTPSLDETHRINITNYVKEFVESKRCSQMFMISHHLGGHNGFNGGEFVVINDTNLLNKPNEYNTNVTFEYEKT